MLLFFPSHACPVADGMVPVGSRCKNVWNVDAGLDRVPHALDDGVVVRRQLLGTGRAWRWLHRSAGKAPLQPSLSPDAPNCHPSSDMCDCRCGAWNLTYRTRAEAGAPAIATDHMPNVTDLKDVSKP